MQVCYSELELVKKQFVIWYARNNGYGQYSSGNFLRVGSFANVTCGFINGFRSGGKEVGNFIEKGSW